jgi:hypothetical protein
MFVQHPHLMESFEEMIINFGISRELRSLDSDIHIYRMSTLIPQVVPKYYENKSME